MSISNIETLRPGFLISLKTSVRGNVKYDKRNIEAETVTEDGEEVVQWETKRTIADAKEFKAASEARSKARSIISSVCVNSAFGLLAPEAAHEELEKSIADARKVADAFNATAKLTRVSIYIMVGKVASDDVEAVRAINSEVSDLLADMERGLRNMDVKVIREAASKAKSVGQMLSPEAAARVQMAVEAARSSARKIVQAGEQAAAEIDLRAIRTVTESRSMFLDLGESKEIAAPQQERRAIDLVPVAQE